MQRPLRREQSKSSFYSQLVARSGGNLKYAVQMHGREQAGGFTEGGAFKQEGGAAGFRGEAGILKIVYYNFATRNDKIRILQNFERMSGVAFHCNNIGGRAGL